MPGFPDIGRDNPFLMSRTDGSIIDAKPYTVNPVSCLSQLLMMPVLAVLYKSQ